MAKKVKEPKKLKIPIGWFVLAVVATLALGILFTWIRIDRLKKPDLSGIFGFVPWWGWLIALAIVLGLVFRKRIRAMWKSTGSKSEAKPAATAPAKREWLAVLIAVSGIILMIWFVNEIILEWHKDFSIRSAQQADQARCDPLVIPQDLTNAGTMLKPGVTKMAKGTRYVWVKKVGVTYYFDPEIPEGQEVIIDFRSTDGRCSGSTAFVRHATYTEYKAISGQEPVFAGVYILTPREDVSMFSHADKTW